MSNKLIDNQNLIKEWDYEKNSNIDLSSLTTGSSKKVWWKCENGHEWQAVIHPRLKGVGCPYCAGKKVIKGSNDFATLYPEMLTEWDYEENDKLGIKPDELSVGSQKKVNWICKNNHKYTRSIYDRLHGRGKCSYCSKRIVKKGINDLATTNPELIKEWDFEKNIVKPDEIATTYTKKVWWKCKKGHSWDATIYPRTKGTGCPYCSNNKVLKGFNDLATTNPEVLNDWNYERNSAENIMPYDISYGSTKKVWWKCKNGHEYQMTLSNKTKGIGCPICSNHAILTGYNDFATKHPKLLEEWDYEKNDKLGIKPNEIILGKGEKVWWKCSKGHEWQSTINSRIRNTNLYHRCPICSSYLRTSIPEKIIYYYIKQYFPKTEANYKPTWLKPRELDIFIPEINVGIEYDGYYYHNDIKRDIEKDDLCLKHDIKIIRIREKKAKPIVSNAIIYNIKVDNNTDYTYVEDALKFLTKYLNISIDFNIKRDLSEIIKMINFMEKENCISNTNPEILDEWNYEKNSAVGITPDNMSAGSSLKIWWKCNEGHDYLATISTKINQSTGCPYCSNKKLLKGYNDFATRYPKLLKEWDFEKNDKLGVKPDSIIGGNYMSFWWKCENGHEWQAPINSRISGSKTNCPYCAGKYAIPGENDLATIRPDLLKFWDYEENDKLGLYPDKVKNCTERKAWWICQKGHKYQAVITNRTHSKGDCCPYCLNTKVLKGFNDFITTNPELAKEWDYTKNIINPDEITNGTRKKIWWICPKNHSYEATIPNRRKGTSCPYCSGNKVLKGFNDIATTCPDLLRKWNYEKNNELGITPESISKSYSKKVWWKCKNGHDYQRYVYNERNGKGRCPICKE